VAANVVSPLEEANNAPKTLSGFEGLLYGGEKRGKGEVRDGKRKKIGLKGWVKNTPKINFWLQPCFSASCVVANAPAARYAGHITTCQ